MSQKDICAGCGESLEKVGTFKTVVRRHTNARGWHNHGIPTCSNCHTMTEWDESLHRNDAIPRTLDEVKEYARDHGSHFFDASTLRFFRSRIAPGVEVHAGRVYFITSEQFEDMHGHRDERRYTVRYMTAGAHFFEVGSFQAYDSLRQARRALAEHIKNS
jgi:hypothetical protein